jgi:Flp pilus assembly pilin Flp
MKTKNILARFRKSECGASMVEYGVALLVTVAVGIFMSQSLGASVLQKVTDANNALNATATPTP